MAKLLDHDSLLRFAPKEIFHHLDAFDQELAAHQSDFRAFLANPFATFRGGKIFPIIHLAGMCWDQKWTFMRLPAPLIREGHRMVNSEGPTEEMAFQPMLRLEIITDRKLAFASNPSLRRELASIYHLQGPTAVLEAMDAHRRSVEARIGTERTSPTMILTMPLGLALRSTAKHNLCRRYILYQHIFGHGGAYPDDGYFYIGITARDWQRRWAEHSAAIKRGSRLKFHRVFREEEAKNRLTFIHHKVMGVTDSLEQVQQLEEAFVAGHWSDERLLNMIPGGKAGLAYLHKHRMLSRNIDLQPDDIETAQENWLRSSPRNGMPAPWIAELWKDPKYALAVICGASNRLSVDQVLAIRAMGQAGATAEVIGPRVGVTNLDKIKRVLDGRTYSRVPKNNC
ncbi:hypothetical protein [Pseudomonas frederiksbergensis]|uniref:hypothetical protein n=1 Tax=Pseudomonas frederiksbergensis TaxID=104087 RepID=UPI003D232857